MGCGGVAGGAWTRVVRGIRWVGWRWEDGCGPQRQLRSVVVGCMCMCCMGEYDKV